jgi:hypothetical protein
VFGVPLGVLLHVASLVKLRRDAVRRPVTQRRLTISTAKIRGAACRSPPSLSAPTQAARQKDAPQKKPEKIRTQSPTFGGHVCLAAAFDDTDQPLETVARHAIAARSWCPGEAVAGKQRRQQLDAVAIADLIPADARQVDFKAK